jgi:hypothetical protein
LFQNRLGSPAGAVSAFRGERNAFREASSVERRGLDVILPYLRSKAFDGQVIHIAKGPLAASLQRTVGDVLMSTDGETVCAVEIKVEQRWTGNLFLETWSNRNLESKAAHAQRGATPGWLVTSRADVLLYFFLDVQSGVLVPVFRLKRWAFAAGAIYEWPELRQARYMQANDTWGRCVPVDVIEREVGARRISIGEQDG